MNQAVIVALPLGNETYIYRDGDEVAVHQTMAYLGEVTNLDMNEVGEIMNVVNQIAERTSPFVAKVAGYGFLGEDREQIVLTESKDLQYIRDQLTLDPTVREVMSRVDQYPTWVSHVSTLKGYKYGDNILFNRLGVWIGEDRRVFDFKTPALFLSE